MPFVFNKIDVPQIYYNQPLQILKIQ